MIPLWQDEFEIGDVLRPPGTYAVGVAAKNIDIWRQATIVHDPSVDICVVVVGTICATQIFFRDQAELMPGFVACSVSKGIG